MSGKPFAVRPAKPASAQAWVREAGAGQASPFTARLTIDVTPAVRARMKIAAFGRDQTVADMVRALFDREFPETPS